VINISEITLKQGDCLELIRQIPNKSVDMILCDLPYGQLNKKNPNAQWDCQIDAEKLWGEYKRITKPNSAICLFANGMFTADLMYSNKQIWKYNLIWDKVAKTGFLNAKKMPLRQHEDICVFYEKLPIYNPQMTKCEPHQRNHTKGNMKNPTKNQCYGDFVEVATIISDEKYPTSIISISKEHCNGKFFHPTQKPVALLEWLINTYTNEGMTVLDNTMGSGSTGVACVNTNRNFIGIELDTTYFEIAKNRIEKAKLDNQQTA
jgi:site-specific DNA-methyltransferase (adenine-specific)